MWRATSTAVDASAWRGVERKGKERRERRGVERRERRGEERREKEKKAQRGEGARSRREIATAAPAGEARSLSAGGDELGHSREKQQTTRPREGVDARLRWQRKSRRLSFGGGALRASRHEDAARVCTRRGGPWLRPLTTAVAHARRAAKNHGEMATLFRVRAWNSNYRLRPRKKSS